MQELFEPSFDELAERALLGGMIVEPRLISVALSRGLKEEDFYFEKHRKVYALLKVLYQEYGENWDDVVALELARKESIPLERNFLWVLAEEGATSEVLFESALRIVKEHSTLNRLKEQAIKLLKAKSIEEAQVAREELIAFKEEVLEIEPFERIVSEGIEELKLMMESEKLILGLETGFFELDTLTSGFEPGNLILIGARPGMGKSSFMLSIALNMARKGKRVVVFSLEMSKKQILHRIFSLSSGVPLKNIRIGMITKEDFTKIVEAGLELRRLPVVFDFSPARTTLEIRSIAQLKQADIIFIDYLQLITPPKQYSSRQEEVAAISRSLKLIAKDLNIPVVALVQLSRQTEHRSDKRPTLADIRESGQIEQDADIVMFLYRPEYYKKNPSQEEAGLVEVIVAKNRQGACGTVRLRFDKNTTGFYPFPASYSAYSESPEEEIEESIDF